MPGYSSRNRLYSGVLIVASRPSQYWMVGAVARASTAKDACPVVHPLFPLLFIPPGLPSNLPRVIFSRPASPIITGEADCFKTLASADFAFSTQLLRVRRRRSG